MRRPPPKKKTAVPSQARPPGDDGTGDRSQKAGVAPSLVDLASIDPRARLTVMTDVSRREAQFTTGAAIREHWESPKIQRVSHFFSNPPAGWTHVRCPDGSRCFIQFTSEEFQLLDQAANQPAGQGTMEKKKHPTPPKKTPAKSPVPPKTPVKKPTPPPVVAPVKPPIKEAAKAAIQAAKPERVAKKPKTTGNYKWLLRRLQAQALSQLTTSNNRAIVRDGLDKQEDYKSTIDFLQTAKVADSIVWHNFLNEFFAATINR